ncbi:MAG: hypothetical protein PHX82_06140 [Paracoccaceae bacterium]|nr:hypothetical protein [Paracoccaceae bacterium]
MTAIIVTTQALTAAEAVAGAQWTVRLSPMGAEPATHIGCNWVAAPPDILDALARIEGGSIGSEFTALCAELGLQVVGLGQGV